MIFRAHVQIPYGSTKVFHLHDNGVSADTFKDDGIYSGYFISTTTLGRYTVNCEVWDDGSAYINDAPAIQSSVAVEKTSRNSFSEQPHRTDSEKTGEFMRIANGGSFMV